MNLDITIVNWVQNECDEQPIGVVVKLNNGKNKFLTTEEYNNLLKSTHDGK